MSAHDPLTRHVFVQRAMEVARPLLFEALDRMPKDRALLSAWRERNRSDQTAAARYLHRIMWRVLNLLRMFEQLERARYLMMRTPLPSRSRTVPLTQNDWTQYHFLVFTACLPAIVDCGLLLTADTLQLGIPARLCTFDLVTSHDFVAGSPVAKALKALRKKLEAHTQRRHRYLHRGEEPDLGELSDPEWLMDLKQVTFLQGAGEVSVDRRLLAGAWRATLRDLKPILNSTERAAYDGTDGVLKALLPKFENRVQLLGPVSLLEEGRSSPRS